VHFLVRMASTASDTREVSVWKWEREESRILTKSPGLAREIT
jgi:hypothetical protein